MKLKIKGIQHLTIGFNILSMFIIGVGVGWFIDQKYHNSPWGIISGLLLAILGVGFFFWRMVVNSKKYFK